MRFSWLASLALVLLLASVQCAKPPDAARATAVVAPLTFTLPNGLAVVIRPVGGTDAAALVVLYAAGEDLDPPGKSGLAHLAEHCYCTAAPPGGRATAFDELVARHPAGFNAQTGRDYMVFASVFPARDLARELDEAARRMGSPAIGPEDLAREIPRLNLELGNMYGGMPELGALNLARAGVCPARSGGRKGGLEQEVSSLTVPDVQGFLDRYVKPANATLVVAGGVRPEEARKIIEARFGGIRAGERAPAFPIPGGSTGRTPVSDGKPARAEGGGSAGGCAAVAVRAPRPAEPDYAAFLAAAARLFERVNVPGGPPSAQVFYAPLDDPDALVLQRRLAPTETAEQAFAGLDRLLAEALSAPFGPADRARAANAFGFLLGLTPLPDNVLRQNLYGVAFSLAMGRKLGIDARSLNAALDALDEAKFRAAAARFAKERRALAVAGRGGQ